MSHGLRKKLSTAKDGKVAQKSLIAGFAELFDLSCHIASSSVKKLARPRPVCANVGSFDFVRLALHFAQDDSIS
jgi:hypothetical protein